MRAIRTNPLKFCGKDACVIPVSDIGRHDGDRRRHEQRDAANVRDRQHTSGVTMDVEPADEVNAGGHHRGGMDQGRTGVGPSIASGSQVWSGNWSLFPTQPAKIPSPAVTSSM